MGDQSLHILTALLTEANAIRRHLRRANLQSVPVIAVGIRAVRLHSAPFITEGSIVIVAGLAGGLDPVLRAGQAVLDAPADIPLPAGAIRGRIHTSAEIVDSVERKASMFAGTGAAAVDMEQAIVAAWAAEHGGSVIGLRAISDGATDTLDPILLTLVDELGRPRPGPLANALLRKPARIADLLRLARRSNLALANLSAAAVELVRQMH